MSEPIVIFSEPLLEAGFNQYRLVVPLAERLSRRFRVTVAAPAFGSGVRSHLEQSGIEAADGGRSFPRTRDERDEVPSFVFSWARDALLGTNRRLSERLPQIREGLRLNFSMTNAVASDLWYIQSRPLGPSLESIIQNLRPGLRSLASLGRPVVDLVDRDHFSLTARNSRRLYTSCRYLSNWYRQRGHAVAGEVPVFFFPTTFGATTSRPSRDYALVYLGKETDTATVRGLFELGVPVRLFGGKSAEWVRRALGADLPPHVTMCGSVSHEELCDLYTNALVTAFPFTDESFGLVPVESMACGTPVLTYADQGPGETVIDGFTGWLAHNSKEFLEAAARLFHRGYPAGMQSACVDRARFFSLDSVAESWTRVIRSHLDGVDRVQPMPAASASPREEGEAFLALSELVGRS